MYVKLDDTLFKELFSKAGTNPRKRVNVNFHSSPNDIVQRMVVAIRKGTYIRPHHHPNERKWELLLILKGRANLIFFEADGKIKEKIEVGENSHISGIEINPFTWHTLVPITEEVIMFEVKEGPYIPAEKIDFASWAPEEGSVKINDFLIWLKKAKIGDYFHSQ